VTGQSGGFTDRLAGAHVLVTGAGVTGPSVARALLARGARVTVTDANADRLRDLAEHIGGVRVAHGLVKPPSDVDLVVTAPGWRPDSPVLAAARAAGVEVIGDVELAWRLCAELPEPPKWLVVTGTNGKTTTVAMLAEILVAAGVDAVACGNIGLPVVDAIAAGHPVLAVELSSFQLYWAPSIRPAAGALLNIAEDHLDWHGGMDAYAAAKAGVLTGAVAIGGVEDRRVATMLAAAPADRKVGVRLGPPAPGELGVSDGHLLDRAFADDRAGEPLAQVDDVRPPGPPGVFDALAAAALARSHGVSAKAVAAGLAAFRPGEHRAAAVAEIDGVRYVDDSKATNPHAAAASLRAHQRVVWIAGGLLKGAHVDDLVTEAAGRLVGAVLLGADREVIATALTRHAPDVPVHRVSGGDDDPMSVMSSAVDAARAMARPGDVVLLAPAAASMDMFSDYKQRGRAFADAVHALAAGRG
jgi:UDP-N-acetylmuramoylalanine--D-glutamate ligase